MKTKRKTLSKAKLKKARLQNALWIAREKRRARIAASE